MPDFLPIATHEVLAESELFDVLADVVAACDASDIPRKSCKNICKFIDYPTHKF